MTIPRLVIAGTHSGVGKTTIATGLMAALAARGLKVQGFKVGPDYIDPSYHTGACSRPSRNLDVWMLGERLVPLFEQAAAGTDIAMIEGVMGLFDGIKGQKSLGSTAHVAKLLGAPVVLIVDVRSSAYSTAALVHGFASFQPGVNIRGVILNRIGSGNHLHMVREAVEDLGIPVIGHLGREEKVGLPERHLGLVPLNEMDLRQNYFSQLAAEMEKGINLDKLVGLAREAGDVPSDDDKKVVASSSAAKGTDGPDKSEGQGPAAIEIRERIKIAAARDQAFSFYYQDALETLQALGAEIINFSPLTDRKLPPGVRGVFIGGGFPESFLPALSANKAMLNSLREAYDRRTAIYAECGGLMYLCREITGFNGESFCGAGLVPAVCAMSRRLQGMGYREGVFLQDSILGKTGTAVRGHEFHYSSITYERESPAYRLADATGENKGCEGFAEKNLLASYLHLNFAGFPELAQAFLKACGQEVGLWASR